MGGVTRERAYTLTRGTQDDVLEKKVVSQFRGKMTTERLLGG